MVEMIEKRKSCRSYTDQPVPDEVWEKLRSFQMKPLYPEIGVKWEVVDREDIRCILKFITPKMIAIYSEKKDGYLENVGFMFQQMELYLQTLGLGVCWLGMGKPNHKVAEAAPGMDFVILLTVGYPADPFRSSPEEFNREPMENISDREDPRLEPARLAPSSCNSQPWYFTHDGEQIHVFWDQHGLIKRAVLAYFNPIDMGIALAHLYLTNPETFRFFRRTDIAAPKGRVYIGTITL